jgi:hypothetical protein
LRGNTAGYGLIFFPPKEPFLKSKIWMSRYLYLKICTPFWITALLYNVAAN